MNKKTAEKENSEPSPEPSSNEETHLVLEFYNPDGDLIYSNPWNQNWSNAIVGRSSDCEITIKEPTVSRQHCLLLRMGEVFILQDLYSRNGTYINEKTVLREIIDPGTEFQIGDATGCFQLKKGHAGEGDTSSILPEQQPGDSSSNSEEASPDGENDQKESSRLNEPPPLISFPWMDSRGKLSPGKKGRKTVSRSGAGRAFRPNSSLLILFGAGILFGWLLIGLFSMAIYLSPLTLVVESNTDEDGNKTVQDFRPPESSRGSRRAQPSQKNMTVDPRKRSRESETTNRQNTSPEKQGKNLGESGQPPDTIPENYGGSLTEKTPESGGDNSPSPADLTTRQKERKDQELWTRLMEQTRSLLEQFQFGEAETIYSGHQNKFLTRRYKDFCRYRREYISTLKNFFNRYRNWVNNEDKRIQQHIRINGDQLSGTVEIQEARKNRFKLNTKEGTITLPWSHKNILTIIQKSLYQELLNPLNRYSYELLPTVRLSSREMIRSLENLYERYKPFRQRTKRYLAMARTESPSEIGFEQFNGRWVTRKELNLIPKSVRKLVEYFTTAERWAMKAVILFAAQKMSHPEAAWLCMNALENGNRNTKLLALDILATCSGPVLRSSLNRSALNRLAYLMENTRNSFVKNKIIDIFSKIASTNISNSRACKEWWKNHRNSYEPSPWSGATAREDSDESQDTSGNETVVVPERPPVSLTSRGLEIVICIDGTASMGIPIDKTRLAVRDISKIFKGMIPDSRMGLVVYRDRESSHFGTVNLKQRLTKNFTRVMKHLQATETSGGGDKPENVELGLELAISDKMGWTPGAGKGVIVIGDNPPHKKDIPRAIELARIANTKKSKKPTSGDPQTVRPIVVSCVGVKGIPGAFRRIARAGGGRAISLKQKNSLVREMVKLAFEERWHPHVRTFLDRAFELNKQGVLEF